MKNVLIIDGARNCEYAIYEVTESEFKTIFPEEGQNVEFIEDLEARTSEDAMTELFSEMWDRRVRKRDVRGIDGTLFYQLSEKRIFYPTKNDEEMINDLTGGPMSAWHRAVANRST